MIMRRVSAGLRRQDWMAIAIELLIVILGVFAGTWVANWNQAESEKRHTKRMLEQLEPALRSRLAFFQSVPDYYSSSRRFANQALAAWAGDRRISDTDFVIAAYQASQVYGVGVNAQLWALSFGGDQLQNIDDPQLRSDLAEVLTADYEPLRIDRVTTSYREDVRKIIPAQTQDQIRAQCGDRTIYMGYVGDLVVLPKSCSLRLDPAVAAKTAATLRARPELANELNWHLSQVAIFLASSQVLEHHTRKLHDDLKHV